MPPTNLRRRAAMRAAIGLLKPLSFWALCFASALGLLGLAHLAHIGPGAVLIALGAVLVGLITANAVIDYRLALLQMRLAAELAQDQVDFSEHLRSLQDFMNEGD